MWNVCKRPVFASGMIIAALIASDHTRAWSQTIPPIPKSTNPEEAFALRTQPVSQ